MEHARQSLQQETSDAPPPDKTPGERNDLNNQNDLDNQFVAARSERSGSPANGRYPRSRRLRIVLYSHDTMGLGHMRRNLLITRALARGPLEATILLLTGEFVTNAFEMPPRVDCLSLPALHKGSDGRYRPGRLDTSLDELVSLRASTILAAVMHFDPDVLLVDKVPRGARRELDPTLEYLRSQRHTRCVLGLRDVLDDPDTVRREWRKAANEEAIRDYYDAVWVYGDPAVYDPVAEYGFSAETAAKVRYTGYLDQSLHLGNYELQITNYELPAANGEASAGEEEKPECEAKPDPLAALPPSVRASLVEGKLALCLVGGGQDGAELAEAFALADLPPDMTGVILVGPFLPEAVWRRLQQIAAGRPRLKLLDFTTAATFLVSRADRVVAMGGYNTVMEVLSFNKRALIMPRIKPRLEQWIRAVRLSDLGLLDVIHPGELTPNRLTEWLARDAGTAPPQARSVIDMDGLSRLPYLLEEALAAPASPRQTWSQSVSGERQYVSY